MPSARQILAFLFASLLVSGLIHRDAMWGGSLLAPLDIGPDLFRNYKFMDPEADGIPDNHHIIDQFTYDLPLQHAIYTAYREGEIPWWDPYTYGGRPLLADAHVNGTDPIRLLCYHLLSFELAYNWNYILRGILTGFGMFLLLSHLGVRLLPAGMLSLAYQFAGWFTLFFGHPWIQASFVYYPYIWLLWTRALHGRRGVHIALSGVACAMVFYAGNLQSHTYLPLFACAFVAAYAIGDERKFFLRALLVCGFSGIIATLLAFPVLANQVEFYLNSLRPVEASAMSLKSLASLPCAAASFYPWAMGTFRTLEPAKLINGADVVFPLFFGAIGSFLAILTIFHKKLILAGDIATRRTALFLILIYFIIIITPLSSLFYSRCSGLAGMGLVILSGCALQDILDGRYSPPKKWIWGFAAFVAVVALISSCLAWMAYPRFKPSIERELAARNSQSSYNAIPSIAAMRKQQIESFPGESSLQNPEAAITLLAVMLFSFAMWRSPRPDSHFRNFLVLAALALGILPVLLFHARYRPKHPIDMWHRMLAGGEAQQQAMAMARKGLRIDESNQSLSDAVFPNAMGTFYRVHCVQGYSALQPPGLFRYPSDAPLLDSQWRADLHFPASADAPVAVAQSPGPQSRFRRAENGNSANISIIRETFNSLELDVTGLDSSTSLIRTDTYYPGWYSIPATRISKFESCFSKIGPLHGAEAGTLTLHYRPSMSRFFVPFIALGAGLAICIAFSPFALARK